MKKIWAGGVVIAALLVSAHAQAQQGRRQAPAPQVSPEEQQTVRWMLPHCRNYLNDRNNQNLLAQGICLGVMRGLIAADMDVCEPSNWTFGQAVRVFIAYAERLPHREHEHFIPMAREAFRAAWPCQNNEGSTGPSGGANFPAPRQRSF